MFPQNATTSLQYGSLPAGTTVDHRVNFSNGSGYVHSWYAQSNLKTNVSANFYCGANKVHQAIDTTWVLPYGVSQPINFYCDQPYVQLSFVNVGLTAGQYASEITVSDSSNMATNTPYTSYDSYSNGIHYSYNPLLAQIGIMSIMITFIIFVVFLFKWYRSL